MDCLQVYPRGLLCVLHHQLTLFAQSFQLLKFSLPNAGILLIGCVFPEVKNGIPLIHWVKYQWLRYRKKYDQGGLQFF